LEGKCGEMLERRRDGWERAGDIRRVAGARNEGNGSKRKVR
jgi:hypothetical protein